MITFVVSVFDRMQMLNACLASLAVQDGEKAFLVCCNGGPEELDQCRPICERYGAVMLATGIGGAGSCYESANAAVAHANSEWLCFPSDDSLYVQGFSKSMLETAQRAKSDLVYCDCVYKLGWEVNSWAPYSILRVEPKMGRIDKTCFLLKREYFRGFPSHHRGWCDGVLIEQLVKDGIKHAKAPGVLVLHQ